MSSTVESARRAADQPRPPRARGHGRRHAIGLGDAGQLDQPGAVWVLLAQRGGRLHRQPGLAHSSGTDQRHQPVRADRLAQLSRARRRGRRSGSVRPQVAGCRRRRTGRTAPGRRGR